jgi:hypothetical protein
MTLTLFFCIFVAFSVLLAIWLFYTLPKIERQRRGREHQHDYEMEFIGDGLEYRLVCKCGDVAPDMETAAKRMKNDTLQP